MADPERKLRILVANAGPDGQGRSDKVVARVLADAGHEVVYAGGGQAPAVIAAAAVQEAVDAVGLTDADEAVLAEVRDALAARGAGDIVVEVFAPAVSAREITAWVGSFLQPEVA